MAARNSTGRPAIGDGDDPVDGVFSAAVALYVGVLVAGVGSVGTALLAVAVDLGVAYAVGFAVGFGCGLGAATVDRRLPERLGCTLWRRLALVAPTVPFVAVWLVPLEASASVDLVALWTVITVIAAGYALSQLAGNRYVDAVTPGDPAETWRWEPPGNVVIDVLLAGMWGFLGVGNLVTGSPAEGLVWLTIAVAWVVSCLAEGRWSFGPWRDRCEIQLYETGLVKRRPYTKTFVPWRDIGHTRLRAGELVLDRGLRDVRFDREELEDPEAVLEAIDRRIAATASD